MSEERTSISIKEDVRDELRRYKAEDGLTYDEAIVCLLVEVDWVDDESRLIRDDKGAEKNQ